MTSTFRTGIRKSLEKLPFQLIGPLVSPRTLGIYYHVVSDKPLPHIRHLYAFKSPRMFKDDLLYLKSHFHLLTYEEWLDIRFSGRKPRKRDLIITFDDGFSQCYTDACPILSEMKVPCIFFITTDYIDNHGMSLDLKASLIVEELVRGEDQYRKIADAWLQVFGSAITTQADLINSVKSAALAGDDRVTNLCDAVGIDISLYLKEQKPYLTRQQIIEMHKAGFTIGSHSTDHTNLASLTEAELFNNILNSISAIRAITTQEKVPFAFPYSAEGINHIPLEAMQAYQKTLGGFFGGNGVLDQGIIQSRFCADSPAGGSPGRSNLPRMLSKAYLEAVIASIPR
jgi:peptidoglycan/xylan/chitin deacetylase (PgdA/CDA1 family)